MLRKSLFIITYILIIIAVYFSAARAEEARAEEARAEEARAEEAKYNRANWKHWIDIDSDCQRTRTEVLIRDSLIPPVFKTSRKCRVKFGLWKCPYTGLSYKESGRLDIDHIVPLANAYKSGAHLWNTTQKRIFANDMDNLLAVQARANRQKGASGPEAWQPQNKNFWEMYAFRWIKIKEKYKLTYTQPELNALFIMLNLEE